MNVLNKMMSVYGDHVIASYDIRKKSLSIIGLDYVTKKRTEIFIEARDVQSLINFIEHNLKDEQIERISNNLYSIRRNQDGEKSLILRQDNPSAYIELNFITQMNLVDLRLKVRSIKAVNDHVGFCTRIDRNDYSSLKEGSKSTHITLATDYFKSISVNDYICFSNPFFETQIACRVHDIRPYKFLYSLIRVEDVDNSGFSDKDKWFKDVNNRYPISIRGKYGLLLFEFSHILEVNLL